MAFSPVLTKTDYNRYLQCPKLLWLSKNRKDLIPPVDEPQQAMFDQGYEVEEYAHKLFAETATVKEWYARGRAETKNYIAEGQKTILQANALTKDLYCKADILHLNPDTNKWDLYEVKSTTQVKEEHIPDLAFQKIAFTNDGIPIDKTYLIHINNQYVKKGEIDPKELLIIEDLTDQVEDLRQITETQIPKALEIIKPTNKQEVQIQIGKQCSNPYECPFKEYCWKGLPEYSIYDIKRLTEDQLKQLQDLKITDIKDVPDDFPLSENQQNQVTAAKTGEDTINKDAIKKELENLKYPLYFLDYETYMSAIPLFDGTRPYQQIVFQYSLHVIKNKGERCEHYEYLHTGKDLPTEKLLSTLQQQIGDTGSVIVWNKSFEMSRNEEMAQMNPKYAELMSSVNSRVFDLMEIFKDQYYVSPGFKGSYSIKKVLPVLVPGLSYSSLEDVQEGGIASLYWFKHVYSDSADKEKIAASLLEYCKMDTLAMVEVLRVLDSINH
ncbi:hypothetical protein C0416_03895 [bacterium]|nr:hypothetical protein [bacterium]